MTPDEESPHEPGRGDQERLADSSGAGLAATDDVIRDECARAISPRQDQRWGTRWRRCLRSGTTRTLSVLREHCRQRPSLFEERRHRHARLCVRGQSRNWSVVRFGRLPRDGSRRTVAGERAHQDLCTG